MPGQQVVIRAKNKESRPIVNKTQFSTMNWDVLHGAYSISQILLVTRKSRICLKFIAAVASFSVHYVAIIKSIFIQI